MPQNSDSGHLDHFTVKIEKQTYHQKEVILTHFNNILCSFKSFQIAAKLVSLQLESCEFGIVVHKKR